MAPYREHLEPAWTYLRLHPIDEAAGVMIAAIRNGRIGCVERGVHDRGGVPTDELIDRAEHTLEDWEVLTDALVGALARRGVMNVDELRRGIEGMPSDEYERAGYYERWLSSMETILTEKGVLAAGELDRRVAG